MRDSRGRGSLTDLELDALKLLRMLCFNQGVYLNAGCVADPREEYRGLLEKHRIHDPIGLCASCNCRAEDLRLIQFTRDGDEDRVFCGECRKEANGRWRYV